MSVQINMFLSVNILDFGARVCDEVQTAYVQAAIDYCRSKGGGQVVIPEGVFIVAGLRLHSKVTLVLKPGAILRGSSNLDDYGRYLGGKTFPIDSEKYNHLDDRDNPFSKRNNAIIQIIDACEVGIIGEPGSFIDGGNCFDSSGEDGYKGPHAINIFNSSIITLMGYTVLDSGNCCHSIRSSKSVVCQKVKMYGGHHGFELWNCNLIKIEDSYLFTCDDCIKGYDNNRVYIKRSVFDSPTSALCFGGNDIVIDSCCYDSKSRYGNRNDLSIEQKERSVLTNSECCHNAKSFFKYFCDGKIQPREIPGEIIVKNCTIVAPTPFDLSFDNKNEACRKYSLKSISFKDCSLCDLEKPIILHGDRYAPTSITLEHIHINTSEKFNSIPIIDAIHFDKIELNNVNVHNFDDPNILVKSQGTVKIENSGEIKIVSEVSVDELYE